MRKKQSSLTAMGIAIARAVESEKPEGERICYDPYARSFISPGMYAVMSFFIKSGYTELRGPGVLGFLIARERYIDDTLQASLEAGLRQLVILGAGFDARAYRFEGLKSGVRVFEVDHPATQEDKVARLQKIFGTTPGHVTFVSIDFNTQRLEERLQKAGYRPDLKTLTIWQGVSEYLTPEAVDETLAFVARCSAPGSAIVFDYVYREVLEGELQSEVRNMRRYRFMSGEGLTFGIPEGTVEAFLRQRGFSQVKDVNAADLKQAYFTGKNAERKVAGGYGIAVGRV